jgi:pimeloyl-ACP methyl ester carboxylesterase
VTFLIIVSAGVLVVAVGHLVVGWHLSNGLHRRALVVGPKQKDLGVRVREVTANRIVLEAPEPRQGIGHPGVVGLSWDGGYGRVRDVIDVIDACFVRRYEPVRGMPPVCTGPLESCPPVEMDSFAYPTDPGDVGLSFEETIYESTVGEMGAWLVPGGDGGRWAVHCHGWTAERREFLRMLPAHHQAGITSLVIDYRNDPGSPRDPTGRYRFGLSEWEDLEGAVRSAIQRGAEDILLSGCSTGGAIVMAFLERSELAPAVSGVVLDSPNILLADTFRLGLSDVRATELMKEFGLWITDLRWKVDWNGTNFVQRADQILRASRWCFTAGRIRPSQYRLAANWRRKPVTWWIWSRRRQPATS